MEYVVSPDGVEANDGSAASPWPLSKGIAALEPGDVLYLRGGTYLERALLKGKHAVPSNPIVITSFPDEHATIDGSVADFREAPNDDWVPGETPGEFVSANPLPRGGSHAARGSFLQTNPYRRLISYSTIKDLQAVNQLFGPIADDHQLEGPTVSPPDLDFPRRPWVYMGPGIFQDESGYIHIRLSPTNHNVAGFAEYSGEADPRQLRLAIWTSFRATLRVVGCTSVYVTDITVRHGARSVNIENSLDVRLDHVNVLAGSYGVHIGPNCEGTVMSHCQVDGGLPPWYFRSDRKDGYRYLLDNGAVASNGLGQNTVKSLIYGSTSCSHTRINYCEFMNGHDLWLFGTGLEFSRNWVTNLNDDALVVETEGIADLKIFENVIEQSLTALNFARETAGNGVRVYRNLIDLRRPIAGVRPRPDGATEPTRLGHLFKGGSPDGPLDLFHNTILVKDQTIGSSFAHFRDYHGESSRRCFNNIFVAVNSVPRADKPISYLPNPTWPTATDGNCYFRGWQFRDGPLLHFNKYQSAQGVQVKGDDLDSLSELRGDPTLQQPDPPPSPIFTDSQAQYPPGFEAVGIDDYPRFRRFDPAVVGLPGDEDFRLHSYSPLWRHGAILPDELRALDNAPLDESPDIGCFRVGADPLSVGVDGRRRYPRGPSF